MSRVIFKQNCVICVQKNTSNLSFVYTAVEDDLNLPVVPVFVLTTIDDSTRRNVEQYRLIIPKIRRKVDHFKRKGQARIKVYWIHRHHVLAIEWAEKITIVRQNFYFLINIVIPRFHLNKWNNELDWVYCNTSLRLVSCLQRKVKIGTERIASFLL